jgi:hypothetical protein
MTPETKLVAGSTLRIVRTLDGGTRRALYGQVLTIAPILPENLGTNGEPTVSVVLLDPQAINTNQLGKVDWHLALDRQTGVRHASHPDVVSGATSIYYTDVLPIGGEEIEMDALNLTDLTKPAFELKDTEEGNETTLYQAGDFHVVNVDGSFIVRTPDGKDVEDASFGNLIEATQYVDAHTKPAMVQNMAPLTPTVQTTQSESYARQKGTVNAVQAAEDAKVHQDEADQAKKEAFEKTSGNSGSEDWTKDNDGLSYNLGGVGGNAGSTVPAKVAGVTHPDNAPLEGAAATAPTALGLNGATEAPVVGSAEEFSKAAETKPDEQKLAVFPKDGKFFVGYNENELPHGPWDTWSDADEWRAAEQAKRDGISV